MFVQLTRIEISVVYFAIIKWFKTSDMYVGVDIM